MTLFELVQPDGDRKSILRISKSINIPIKVLEYYNDNGILPDEMDLERISTFLGLSNEEVMLKLGIYNEELREAIARASDLIIQKIKSKDSAFSNGPMMPDFETEFGKLYKGDCLNFLRTVPNESFDIVFADPPFNLKKFYLSAISDNMSFDHYINWTESWLTECIRTLKLGGSLYLWNIPKWNTHFSAFLNRRLSFRHWIATDIKLSLPISGRLYPAHYSLLYYTKGDKVNTFHPDRLPMEVCPKCFVDLKDYGGYKDKMNPLGVNLTDVWNDIPPVRHKKYKRREEANELSVKLLDRIIEMSSNEGDTIFDPFGGSGTTYVVAELKKRKWVGTELGPIDTIRERFQILGEEFKIIEKYRNDYNNLFTSKTKAKRMQLNLWTDESFL